MHTGKAVLTILTVLVAFISSTTKALYAQTENQNFGLHGLTESGELHRIDLSTESLISAGKIVINDPNISGCNFTALDYDPVTKTTYAACTDSAGTFHIVSSAGTPKKSIPVNADKRTEGLEKDSGNFETIHDISFRSDGTLDAILFGQNVIGESGMPIYRILNINFSSGEIFRDDPDLSDISTEIAIANSLNNDLYTVDSHLNILFNFSGSPGSRAAAFGGLKLNIGEDNSRFTGNMISMDFHPKQDPNDGQFYIYMLGTKGGASCCIAKVNSNSSSGEIIANIGGSEFSDPLIAIAWVPVEDDPPPQITTLSLAKGIVENAYSDSLTAIEGTPPFSWILTNGTALPAGLNLNSVTGEISGIPTTTPGTFNLTVQVTDSGSPPELDTKTLSIQIDPPTPVSPPTCKGPNFSNRQPGQDFVSSFIVQDDDNGLQSITTPVRSPSITVSIPSFPLGTKDPVTITVTRKFGLSGKLRILATNIDQRTVECPVDNTPPELHLVDIPSFPGLGPLLIIRGLEGNNPDLFSEVRGRFVGQSIFSKILPFDRPGNEVKVELSGNLFNRIAVFDLAGNFSFFDIEPQVVVNGLIDLIEETISTSYDSTPVPDGPAGTFTIIAKFENISGLTISKPFFQVTQLTGGNKLLNADGSAKGVGATMTPPGSESFPFNPGSVGTFQFEIGLQKREKFSFFVNMLGQANP